MNNETDDTELKEFEQRSDFIDESDIKEWNVEIEHFEGIQKKLLSSGIKVLVGPRGTGKTHQMRLCYSKCKADSVKPFCIYVSFSKYFRLEPFLTSTSNAIQIFHSWVLSKIILSCLTYLRETQNESLINNFSEFDNIEKLEKFISDAERGLITDESILRDFSISKVINLIERISLKLQRKRSLVLLDDAALTLTPDYLVEFFDIIRSLKTRDISLKASVYPGTTEYGPRFHIGHDAEEIPCWLSIDEERYNSFMNELIQKRFGQYVKDIRSDIIELFKYASFGIPRSFISLLSTYSRDNAGTVQNRFNNTLSNQAEFIRTEYLSISQKLPQYKNVIDKGMNLFSKSIEFVRENNVRLPENEKSIVLGILSEGIENNNLIKRIIQFLTEAGLFYDKGTVSHGEKRSYNRYIPHILFSIENRSFSGNSRGFNTSEILGRLNGKPTKHPIRKSIEQLLNPDEIKQLGLDLPNCQHCGAKRISPEQKFCHICGSELVNDSTFKKCLNIPVDQLLLTQWQKNTMKENGFNKIEDFITLKDPASKLRNIRRIGEVKAQKITEEVQRFVDEFLT